MTILAQPQILKELTSCSSFCFPLYLQPSRFRIQLSGAPLDWGRVVMQCYTNWWGVSSPLIDTRCWMKASAWHVVGQWNNHTGVSSIGGTGLGRGYWLSHEFITHVSGAEAVLGRELEVSLPLFLGKSRLGPGHAMMHVERLDRSARVRPTEGRHGPSSPARAAHRTYPRPAAAGAEWR